MPVRRAQRSWRFFLVPGLAVLLASSLVACGGSSDGDPSPAPSEAAPQAAIAVEPPETEPPLPLVDATAASTDVDAPVTEAIESSSPAEADTPPPIVPLTAGSNGPAVPVAGPLLVFSEDLAVDWSRPQWGRTVTRRVSVYDLSADRYWGAFDYPHIVLSSGIEQSVVQVADESLIVWTEDEVHCVSLKGEPERVLFEHDEISWLEVSPDGTKVAIVYGVTPSDVYGITPSEDTRQAAVRVVDIATGQELLDTGRRFDPIFVGWSAPLRQRWHGDGTALLVEEWGRPGLLRLDGTFDVLTEDWHVSPDLRYALRVGEEVGVIPDSPRHIERVWESLDVLDVETGDVLWTVQAQEGGGLYAHLYVAGDGWWGPGFSKEPVWEDRRHVFFTELAPEPDWRVGYQPSLGVLKVLDVATGEVQPFTTEVEERLRGRIGSDCGLTSSGLCRMWYDGRVVWEGAAGWFRYLGVVALAEAIDLRGIAPRGVAVEPDPPPPPLPAEMVGPLLLYEVYRPHPTTPRLAIAYDAGSGTSWALHRHEYHPHYYPYYSPSQAAQGGFVACSGSGLLYMAVDGQTRTLLPNVNCPRHRVAPDGRMVAIEIHPDIVVLGVPSGEEILRVERNDILRAFAASGEDQYLDDVSLLESWAANGWSLDGTALLTQTALVVDDSHGYVEPLSAIVTIDGQVTALPLDVESDGSNLSPDARYIVRGYYDSGVAYYPAYNWRHIDVIDFESGQVLWSLDADGNLGEYHWEWATPTHFAWSGHFHFYFRRPDWWGAEWADISVIDVTTGEIVVMDSADYLARFPPPPRATTDCPENPGHSCKILLDGEVVGEGRWPIIIGVVELD